MSDSTKDAIIKELKNLVRKENLNIDDMIEMLQFTRTYELILFKRSIDRILSEWKSCRKIPKLSLPERVRSQTGDKKKVVNL